MVGQGVSAGVVRSDLQFRMAEGGEILMDDAELDV